MELTTFTSIECNHHDLRVSVQKRGELAPLVVDVTGGNDEPIAARLDEDTVLASRSDVFGGSVVARALLHLQCVLVGFSCTPLVNRELCGFL